MKRTLPGNALVLAIGITALVFTAVTALSSVVLITIRGSGNVSRANAAFYAAEASVERALFASVGHRSGFEHPSRTDVPVAATYLEDPDSFLSLVTNSPTGTTASFIIRSRSEHVPSGDGTWTVIRPLSSAQITLSVDTADAEDAAAPRYLAPFNALHLTIKDFKIPASEDPPPDFRINEWRGSMGSRCYIYNDPVELENPSEYCPGPADRMAMVKPDDPDMGSPLYPMIFASIPCVTGDTTCGTTWLANPPGDGTNFFAPIGSITPPSSDLSYAIVRDLDLTGTLTEYDTYLTEYIVTQLGDPQQPFDPLIKQPEFVRIPVLPGDTMLDTNGEAIPPEENFPPIIPLTELDPSAVEYRTIRTDPTSPVVPGALAATGPAISQTRPDDYLYVDACTRYDVDHFECEDGGDPDGRVSSPWNLELKLFVWDPTDRSAPVATVLRRIRSQIDEPGCITYNETTKESTLSLQCVFDAPQAVVQPLFPVGGTTSSLLAGQPAYDVQLVLTTDTRSLEVRLTGATALLPGLPEAQPVGADQKTTITAIGWSGAARQTLETTIFQDEALPIFRRTTVF